MRCAISLIPKSTITAQLRKKKKMAQTRNSINANVNNPYPNEHIDEKRVIRALLLKKKKKKKKVYSITQLCQKLNQ